jgi:hypothetical protein
MNTQNMASKYSVDEVSGYDWRKKRHGNCYTCVKKGIAAATFLELLLP